MPLVDPQRPENAGVLRYIGPAAASDDTSPDEADRLHLGTHPDLVAHLWDELAPAFETDARALVGGYPALVDPASGVIVAIGLGTTYALRLAADDFEAAIAAGHGTVHEYRTVGRTLDVGHAFGPGWVFGAHADDEVEWLRRAAALL